MSTYYDGDCDASRESRRMLGCMLLWSLFFWACLGGLAAHWLWSVAR